MTDAQTANDPGGAPAPRPAASLVLLRDGPQGLEALLLERPSEDRVLAGARVFPGGKLDREDAEPSLIGRLDADPAVLHARLGEPELTLAEAAALHVAAVREAFEETGVLLGRAIDPEQAERARALRREGLGFGELLEHLALRLDGSLLRPWSRWVTPKTPTMMRKRFDTRFFVARLPEGQQAQADQSEAVAADWMRPREALERYGAGEIDMAAPQIMTLLHLAHFADVAAAIADAGSRVPPVIRPETFAADTGRLVCYPGDPRHPIRERAMPGPTALLFENNRFRPEGGLGAWFD